jgi:hypothetical protein
MERLTFQRVYYLTNSFMHIFLGSSPFMITSERESSPRTRSMQREIQSIPEIITVSVEQSDSESNRRIVRLTIEEKLNNLEELKRTALNQIIEGEHRISCSGEKEVSVRQAAGIENTDHFDSLVQELRNYSGVRIVRELQQCIGKLAQICAKRQYRDNHLWDLVKSVLKKSFKQIPFHELVRAFYALALIGKGGTQLWQIFFHYAKKQITPSFEKNACGNLQKLGVEELVHLAFLYKVKNEDNELILEILEKEVFKIIKEDRIQNDQLLADVVVAFLDNSTQRENIIYLEKEIIQRLHDLTRIQDSSYILFLRKVFAHNFLDKDLETAFLRSKFLRASLKDSVKFSQQLSMTDLKDLTEKSIRIQENYRTLLRTSISSEDFVNIFYVKKVIKYLIKTWEVQLETGEYRIAEGLSFLNLLGKNVHIFKGITNLNQITSLFSKKIHEMTVGESREFVKCIYDFGFERKEISSHFNSKMIPEFSQISSVNFL